jgi:aromatic-L-amino-acid decarboxylase
MGSEAGEGSRLSKPLDVEEFRKHAHQMVDFVADYHRDIESFPVRSQVKPGYLRPLLPDSAPAEPETVEDVFADLWSKILPGITHWQSPKFFGYYPCNVSTAGMLGEMLCGGLNVNGFSWITSPAATELETIVLDWLGKLLHLPEEFLSTSGKCPPILHTLMNVQCCTTLCSTCQIWYILLLPHAELVQSIR